ncbi:hypothetical protein BR93DRAFT_427159 [Coniochaeta sp. PMI_546]|nr:hypothetical protein BR93DRAFT_427159 [Coniochaeta sp. PMI_546]
MFSPQGRGQGGGLDKASVSEGGRCIITIIFLFSWGMFFCFGLSTFGGRTFFLIVFLRRRVCQISIDIEWRRERGINGYTWTYHTGGCCWHLSLIIPTTFPLDAPSLKKETLSVLSDSPESTAFAFALRYGISRYRRACCIWYHWDQVQQRAVTCPLKEFRGTTCIFAHDNGFDQVVHIKRGFISRAS